MLLAVNIPLQEPQVGQACCSNSVNLASSILPAESWPTPSNTLIRSIVFPLDGSTPAFIGPPDTNTVGMFTRAAAISMPGTILSQFGMQIIAVEAMRPQHGLHTVGDQLSAGQRVLHPDMPHGDPVTDPNRVELKRNSSASRTAWRTLVPTHPDEHGRE